MIKNRKNKKWGAFLTFFKNTIWLFFFLIFVFQSFVYAGQFVTEDPVPTEYGHYEINPYVYEEKVRSLNVPELPSAEFNMGVYPELQAHMIIGTLLYALRKGSNAYGYTDTEIGMKYRFVQETDDFPQLGFYPKIILPSGDVERGTGEGGASESVPVWFLKNWGGWKLSGGGGYTFTQAPDTFNFPFGGLLLQHDLTKELTLGGEFYAQGKFASDYRSHLRFTFGGNYNFTEEFGILFSVGHSIAGEKILAGYIGLDFILGPSG